MAVECELALQWTATPRQLVALGAALWRWGAGAGSVYRSLDSQALADLIAGRLPASTQAAPGAVRVTFQDGASANRRDTAARLRREIPAGGVEDILVDGTSWNALD